MVYCMTPLLWCADRAGLRTLREAGRGGFDVGKGVDRSDFIAHMPGPISQAFYRAEREQPPALAATRAAAAAAQAAAAMGMGRYRL
jgi:hypothetical protein